MDTYEYIEQNGKGFFGVSGYCPPVVGPFKSDWGKSKKYGNFHPPGYRAYSPNKSRGNGLPMSQKEKKDTGWYDDLCILIQKIKKTEPAAASELRNILWEQVKLLLYARVRDFINEKKSAILKHDPELCQQLYQDTFFIFQKACDIWDVKRKTKFITFLGDILNQEILNVIRLDLYHKTRDRKIYKKMFENFDASDRSDVDRGNMLEEVKHLFENFSFKSELERTIVRTIMYGKKGDWPKALKRSRIGFDKFYKVKRDVICRLKDYLLKNGSPFMKETLEAKLSEKS